MKRNIFVFLRAVMLLALLFSVAACKAQADPQKSGELRGTITISGAFALYPMMQRWAEEFQKQYAEVTFDISAGGAGKGMADTLSGAVDIGMVSREISADEEAKGAYPLAVIKDAVFPTISAQNPILPELLAKGLNQTTLEGIFITGAITTWGEAIGKPEISHEIHVYTRSDACGAAETWAKYLGNKKQENLLGIGVSGDPGLLDAVIKDPLGIGYNNLNYAYDMASGKPVAGALVLPIDANNDGQAGSDELLETKLEAVDAVASGRYPSPPARLLYLVTNGKPADLVSSFLEWILTDGQQYVGEAGYIPLTKEQLEASLAKLR